MPPIPIERCRWPSLDDPYGQALEQVVRFVLERYAVYGIIASGTILRGHPDPSSDLDIYVLHREASRQRSQRYFNGVPAEIFVNPPHAVRSYFLEEQAAHRPLTAHMLASGYVVLDDDPIVEALRAEAVELLAHPPAPPADLTMARYGIALLYEDAVDVADRDEAAARLILARAVDQMIAHCFVCAGRFVPRPKDLLRELQQLAPITADLALAYYGSASLPETLHLAGQLADRTVGARGFFEWESALEPVPE